MKLLRILPVPPIAVPASARTPQVDAGLDKAGDCITTGGRAFTGLVGEETDRRDRRQSDRRELPLRQVGSQ